MLKAYCQVRRKMACVENLAPMNVDSEMEEGEIVDDLSDISSEEEFLLRQRLEVLESYNNVLERKKAKHSSHRPGNKHKREDVLSYELSEISATELEDYCSPCKTAKVQKHQKIHHKQKRKKDEPIDGIIKHKDHKKKTNRPKRKLEVKVISETSEESGEEYRSRRKNLADAVVVNKTKNDKTSLSERLQKMLSGVNPEPVKIVDKNTTETDNIQTEILSNCSPISSQNIDDQSSGIQNNIQDNKTSFEVIDICSDEDNKSDVTLKLVETIDLDANENECDNQKVVDRDKVTNKDSDDDLELLRQHALKTKTVKSNKVQNNKVLSEEEDSDTTELRLICLKSALLKKAIEMKRKQKLQKKLSQSSNLQDDTFDHIMMTETMNVDNNTDIESVDMEIGSDGDDKVKENEGDCIKSTATEQCATLDKNFPILMVTKEDELEEDEDLLRARLLTSLSKNLPNLVSPNIVNSIQNVKETDGVKPKKPPVTVIPEEKRFIINVDSDSEGEHEATKNLTKMHMKLSEQVDFQQKLDMFLKSTRMEVEKTKLPDVVQQPVLPKKNEKFVAKAVKNLPKSEQIEYKNLVKRMSELEKIKQARHNNMILNNKVPITGSTAVKETLKPRNVTFDGANLTAINSLEEKITVSRKHIAEESAKMLQLKEEGTKLFQKFKIAVTELRNIKTAIALNKKQQRSAQNFLTKIRLHHQMLLKSSLHSVHSKPNALVHANHINPKLQKEKNPKDHNPQMEIPKENNKNPAMLKTIKYGITNDATQAKPNDAKQAKTNDSKQAIANDSKQTKQNDSKHPKANDSKQTKTNDSKQTKPNDSTQTKPENKPKPIEILHPRLCVQFNVTNHKKVVTVPNYGGGVSDSQTDKHAKDLLECNVHSSNPVVEKGGGTKETASFNSKRRGSDDYKSPLDALGSTTWQEDPNAILCPFEVCGDCKDSDCKYLHTKTRSK